MKYIIEQAKLEDAKELDKMLTSLIQDERENYDKNINENYKVKDFFEQKIGKERNCVLVAKADNQILGYVYGFIQDNGQVFDTKIAQLDSIFVKNEYRGQKIAKNLIQEFVNWAKNQGASEVELSVCKGNKKAINLYKNEGFEEDKLILSKKI